MNKTSLLLPFPLLKIRMAAGILVCPEYSNWAKTTLNNMCKGIVRTASINAQELQKIKILKAPINLHSKLA
jgi:hypothetical protein